MLTLVSRVIFMLQGLAASQPWYFLPQHNCCFTKICNWLGLNVGEDIFIFAEQTLILFDGLWRVISWSDQTIFKIFPHPFLSCQHYQLVRAPNFSMIIWPTEIVTDLPSMNIMFLAAPPDPPTDPRHCLNQTNQHPCLSSWISPALTNIFQSHWLTSLSTTAK